MSDSFEVLQSDMRAREGSAVSINTQSDPGPAPDIWRLSVTQPGSDESRVRGVFRLQAALAGTGDSGQLE